MTQTAASRPLPEYVIRPYRSTMWADFLELVRFRGLLLGMVRRQLRIQFSELYLGFMWTFARPVTMTVMFVYFRNISQAQVGVEIPYSVYLYSGIVFWFFFIEAVSNASAAISRDSGLIRKVYFPRLISPLVSLCSELVILAVASSPLLVMMLHLGLHPGWTILLLPLVILQVGLLVLGLGCIFSALAAESQDWQRLLGLALYLGLFISPVIYSPAMIPAKAQFIYHLNPMAGSLIAFRACLFSDMTFPLAEWLYSAGASVFLAALGLYIFKRYELKLLDSI